MDRSNGISAGKLNLKLLYQHVSSNMETDEDWTLVTRGRRRQREIVVSRERWRSWRGMGSASPGPEYWGRTPSLWCYRAKARWEEHKNLKKCGALFLPVVLVIFSHFDGTRTSLFGKLCFCQDHGPFQCPKTLALHFIR